MIILVAMAIFGSWLLCMCWENNFMRAIVFISSLVSPLLFGLIWILIALTKKKLPRYLC